MNTTTDPRLGRQRGNQPVVVSFWSAIGGALIGLFYVIAMPFIGVPVVLVVVAARALRGGKAGELGEEPAPSLPDISALLQGALPAPRPVEPPGPTAAELVGPLVEQLGCEYIVVDANLCITHHVTPSGWNAPATSLVGRSCHEALHASESPCGACGGECPADVAIATGRPAQADHVHFGVDGEERSVDVTAMPVAFDSDGDVTHVALLVHERS